MIRLSAYSTGATSKLVENLNFYQDDSRYRKLKVYIDDQARYYHDLPIPPHNFPATEDDTYYKVETQTADRLDYVSHVVYRNSKLWWVAAMANDIEDPDNVPIGTVLNIPAQSSLYGHGGALS
ncbi:hypothetical protein SP15_049 [Bacillus phage SP-15]|uniref:LysM domain-containing protein n=1 Tax=Bacillus phage SP-15 TaxID=1792032 RepID=A0A127AW31_9CAUD|nr:baseplate wedge subunit [Bacillus phage SP-15]AMM44848.1 hypothetical protein SP15_049 [Bacillus phage SP-15]